MYLQILAGGLTRLLKNSNVMIAKMCDDTCALSHGHQNFGNIASLGRADCLER
jgi:hypothetical protein